MTYANNDIRKKIKYFILFKNHQDNEAVELQPTEAHKNFIRAVTFMDMLLLTLPESIHQCCKEYNKKSIVLENEFDCVAKTKGCYDEKHIPTISTFILPDLQPSTILADPDLVTQYSTPLLQEMLKTSQKTHPPKQKKKTSLISHQYEYPPPPTIEADYVPPSHPPLPAQDNLHNVQIGKLCQDYAKIVKEFKTTMAPLQSMQEKMMKARIRKEFQTTLMTVITTLDNIAKTTSDDECTAALDAFNESKLANTPILRKRKCNDEDKEENESANEDDSHSDDNNDRDGTNE
jgi:hypothetical protein